MVSSGVCPALLLLQILTHYPSLFLSLIHTHTHTHTHTHHSLNLMTQEAQDHLRFIGFEKLQEGLSLPRAGHHPQWCGHHTGACGAVFPLAHPRNAPSVHGACPITAQFAAELRKGAL